MNSRRTTVALALALSLAGCANDRLIARKLTGDTDTAEAQAAIARDCATLREDRRPDMSGLCTASPARAARTADRAATGTESADSPSTALRPAAVPCDGVCAFRQYQAARALDREFHTDAGTQGWFGATPGTPCTGLCSLQRYKAAKALDRRLNTNIGTLGWFGQ